MEIQVKGINISGEDVDKALKEQKRYENFNNSITTERDILRELLEMWTRNEKHNNK